MQLAAQRIALNLREAGFNVQVASAGAQHVDLMLRKLPQIGADPQAALEQILRSAGANVPVIAQGPASLYKTEQTVLDEKKIIPLLELPRAYATGARVRDLRLGANGSPDLADASLEDTR
jgi:MarR-like DNA-binding transcriptional regulator SgrR of sgrS sRNA